jgi:hypothetical protein
MCGAFETEEGCRMRNNDELELFMREEDIFLNR